MHREKSQNSVVYYTCLHLTFFIFEGMFKKQGFFMTFFPLFDE